MTALRCHECGCKYYWEGHDSDCSEPRKARHKEVATLRSQSKQITTDNGESEK